MLSEDLSGILQRAQKAKHLGNDDGTKMEDFLAHVVSWSLAAINIERQVQEFTSDVASLTIYMNEIKATLEQGEQDIEQELQFITSHGQLLSAETHAPCLSSNFVMEAVKTKIVPQYTKELTNVGELMHRIKYSKAIIQHHGQTVRSLWNAICNVNDQTKIKKDQLEARMRTLTLNI